MNLFKNEFKKIIESFLEIESFRGDLHKFRTFLRLKRDMYNDLLKPKAGHELMDKTLEKRIVLPVPFSSLLNNDKVNLFYIGLNPKYGDEMTENEKMEAGNDAEDYINFYNVDLNENPDLEASSFQSVLEDSKYYHTVIQVLFSMYEFNGSNYPDKECLKETYKSDLWLDYFKKLTKDKTIVFPELIPLHSLGANFAGLKDILEKSDHYRDYFNSLVKLISNNISDDGMVIGNGAPVRTLFKNYFAINKIDPQIDHKVLTLYLKDDATYLLFGGQLFSSGCKVKTIKNMSDIIYQIKKYLSSESSKEEVLELLDDISERYSRKAGKSNAIKEKNPVRKNSKKKDSSKDVNTVVFNKDQKKIIDKVIKEVTRDYQGISGTSSKLFYPSVFEKDITSISKSMRTVTYERLYTSKQLEIALQVYEPSSNRGQEVLDKGRKSDFPFKIKDNSNSGNMKIYHEDIYPMDGLKSDELIEEEFRRALIGFLDRYNDVFVRELY